MHPKETARRYNAIASRWDANRKQSKQGVRFLERAIQFCGTPGRALDVGCGSGGLMMAKLVDSGFEITGLDAASEMLALARSRYPAVKFIHANIVEWAPPEKYGLIVAWDSTFHLPYVDHAPVLEKLCNSLSPGGVLLFTAGGVDGEITGTMFDIEFAYSSLSDQELVQRLHQGGCVPVLMERDQYPLHHLVLLAVQGTLNAP